MNLFISPHLLFSLLLSLLYVGVVTQPAVAVPVLNKTAKHAVAQPQKKEKIRKPTNTPSDIRVVGAYRDITKSKRKITAEDTKTARRAEMAKIATTVIAANAPATDSAALPAQRSSGLDDSSLRKKLSAKSAIVVDAESGQELFALSPDTPRQPASTIKILTGMIAIKSLQDGESVPVSVKAAGQPSSKVNLNHEKHYKADDLINAVLLSSANDASVALAEKIAGSENSFAKMMTMQAKLCGAQQTVCKTANGLTADGQSSTARDLASIFRYAMQDDEFSQRMGQIKARTAEGKLLKNHNKALWQIQGAVGGKTGFTNAAGQTYVGKFKRGSQEIIVAIMGSKTMWGDLKNLVEYGFGQTAAPTVASGSGAPQMVAALPSPVVPRNSRQQ